MAYEISLEAANAIKYLKVGYSNYDIACMVADQTRISLDDQLANKLLILKMEFLKSPKSMNDLMDILVNDTYKIKKEKTKREKVQEALCKYYGFGVGESILKQIDEIYGVNSDGTEQY